MKLRNIKLKTLVRLAFAAMLFCVCVWLASVALIYSFSEGRIFDSARIEQAPHCKAGVVLGCRKILSNGLGNLYFSRRIAAAAELYKSGKVDYLIVSGDNHIHEYDEPTDMKESLIEAGIPEERIVCDYAGFRTLDSVVRAKKVFCVDSFIIVTQEDHLRRAIFTARGFGCDAYGYVAEDVNLRYSVLTRIREQFAKISAVGDVIIRRNPKFLGPQEPLD